MFKMDDNFRRWLNENKYGMYYGHEITPETEMVAYTYVISAIVITWRHNTRYYFKEAEKGKATVVKVLCILCNLIFGWWGIPWGPIWTIKETICNLGNMDVKLWGTIAGKPYEEDGKRIRIPSEEEKKEEKKQKKINMKDLIIYILIGAAIGIALIITDLNS